MEAADCGSVDGGAGVCVVASVASTCSLTLACVSARSRDCSKQWQSVCVGGSAKQTDGSISGISGVGGGSIRMSDASDGGDSGGGRDCDIVERATGRERR